MIDHYIKVECTKEVEDRTLYHLGSTYSSLKTTGDKSTKYWVGIPGHAGHDFSKEEFYEHFDIVK